MEQALTLIEVLESEYRYLVEAIEHGSSDPAVVESLIKELEEKTGYVYYN